MSRTADDWVSEIEKLKEENARLREVLSFYANWANYKDQKITEYDCELSYFHSNPIGELIGGMRARKALGRGE